MSVFSYKIRKHSSAQIENICLKFGLDVEVMEDDKFYRYIDITGPDLQVAKFHAAMSNNRDKIFCEFLAAVDEAPVTSKVGNYRIPGQPIQKVPGVKLEVVK